ncbi:MAG: tetratricopeptide repeat protein, partial [Aggregatilineales bacterium]
MKPPRSRRLLPTLSEAERRALLRKRHPADALDPFASDPDPDIRLIGQLALRQPDQVDYAFVLGDFCADRSWMNGQRLLILYVGKALIAYRRAEQKATNDFDRLQAQRTAEAYARWVIEAAQAYPTQRNLAVALWVAAADSDDMLPTLNLSPELTKPLLALYAARGHEASTTTGGETQFDDATAFSDDMAVYDTSFDAPPSPPRAAAQPPAPLLNDTTSAGHAEAPPASEDDALDYTHNELPLASMEPSAEDGVSETPSSEHRIVRHSVSETDFHVGDRIDGRYEVYEIKLGGMGVVYLCYDHEQRMPIAIKSFQKRFMDNERAVARFEQEALTWVRLEKHLHIVRALLVQKILGRPHILLEHISGMEGLGVDLRSWIEHHRLTLDNTLLFAIHVALGMQHATQKIPGLVHRDLKPGNILVTHDGIAKVTDFGLVRSLEPASEYGIGGGDASGEFDDRLTRAHAFVGTPPYMSPEQFTSRTVDLRADIYSFGCMLYEMLTGQPPFKGRNMAEWQHQHTTVTPDYSLPPLKQAPSDLVALLAECLQKSPDHRPAGWSALVERLSQLYEAHIGALPVLATDGEALEARELIDKGYSLTELGRYYEALEAYDQAIAINSYNARYWGRRGRALRLLERYDDALDSYRRALDLQPDDGWLWNGLGIIYDRMRQSSRALESFERSVRLDPKDTWSWYNLGDLQFRIGQVDQAIRSLQTSLEVDPHNHQAWGKLGKIYRAAQNLPAAVQAYEQAIALEPTYAWAYNGLGLTLKAMRKLEEAVTAFKRAAHYEPQVVWHWYNLAETLVEMQRYVDALHPAQEATRIAPDQAAPWGKLGQVLRYLRRHEEAIYAYDRAIALDPQFDWAINGRGLVLENMERYEEALSCYQQATAINPEREWHWYNQGHMLYQLNRPEEALAILEEALRRRRHFPRAWSLIGSIRRQLGHYHAALEALQTSLDQDAQQAWTWSELASTYEALKQYDLAEEAYGRAFAIDRHQVSHLYKQAEMLVQLNRNEQALKLLQYALRLNERSANLWAKLGQVQRKLNQLDESLTSFDRALALDPQYTWAWYGKGLTLSAMKRHEKALECFQQA